MAHPLPTMERLRLTFHPAYDEAMADLRTQLPALMERFYKHDETDRWWNRVWWRNLEITVGFIEETEEGDVLNFHIRFMSELFFDRAYRIPDMQVPVLFDTQSGQGHAYIMNTGLPELLLWLYSGFCQQEEYAEATVVSALKNHCWKELGYG